MPHRTDHVVHQLKEFLNKPIPGGGKWWHVVLLCAVVYGLGIWTASGA